MSLKTRIIITFALLLLALCGTVVAAKATVGAVQQLQQQQTRARQGDVSTIQPWMTVPYIAHVYHVPESYLYQALHITKEDATTRHSTLREIALRTKRPISSVLRDAQAATLKYRKEHPFPSPTPRPSPVRHATQGGKAA